VEIRQKLDVSGNAVAAVSSVEKKVYMVKQEVKQQHL
jgi:hypothetical protein